MLQRARVHQLRDDCSHANADSDIHSNPDSYSHGDADSTRRGSLGARDPNGGHAPVGETGVRLTWTAPSSTGTSAVTNYRIYRGTVSGQLALLMTVGNVLTFRDAAATSGVLYFYKVSAINTAGEGPQSVEASATAQ